MLNFDYHNPTRILFGKGEIAKLSELIPKQARVLLLYGGGSIKQNGVYDQVASALGEHQWSEFSGIEANPTIQTLSKAVDRVRAEGIDYLLAVGGGSVIDGSKLVAAAAKYEGDPWDILAKQLPVTDALPLGCVLTLPATGSESNGNSVVTNTETKQKLAFSSPLVFPRFAVLDPQVTFSLPPRQLANGVVDAFVHVMEQYLTYPVNAPIQDRFAEGLLQTLIEEGPKALAEPDNYEVRANIMWAATLALNTLIGKGVPQDWATHMIGHELTALHGLDHAQTLAVVLPNLLSHQKEIKAAKLLQFAKRVWQLDISDKDQAMDEAIARTRAFFESMGVKTRLNDYGIDQQAIPAMVAQLERHGMVKLGEHGRITPADAKAILTMAC